MKTQRVDLPDGTSTVIEWHGGTQHPGMPSLRTPALPLPLKW